MTTYSGGIVLPLGDGSSLNSSLTLTTSLSVWPSEIQVNQAPVTSNPIYAISAWWSTTTVVGVGSTVQVPFTIAGTSSKVLGSTIVINSDFVPANLPNWVHVDGPVVTTSPYYAISGWYTSSTAMNFAPAFPAYRIVPWWTVDIGTPEGAAYGSANATQIGAAGLATIISGTQTTDVSGIMSGQVVVAGSPFQGAMVRAYYRPTGALIYSAQTDANGQYTIKYLQQGQSQLYQVICDAPSAIYNDQVKARVSSD